MIRKKIKNEQVLDFLEKNPDFFINNPNALEKINFPLKYNAEYNDKSTVYGKKNQLIMDAVDNQLKIFEEFNQDIYSNAIYSLGHEFFESSSLLVFGSKDKHFLDNKAYDLILFFSNIVQEKLKQFSNE